MTKANKKTVSKKFKKTQRTATRLFLLISTLVLFAVGSFGILRTDLKIVKTQAKLGVIADNINLYNESLVKSDEYTSDIEREFKERNQIMNSDDPVVAFAAKHGFSMILCIACLAVPFMLAYTAWLIFFKYRLNLLKLEERLFNQFMTLSFAILATIVCGIYLALRGIARYFYKASAVPQKRVHHYSPKKDNVLQFNQKKKKIS